MTFQVRILPRAERDIQAIYDWLAERSPQGAGNWYAALKTAWELLATEAPRFGPAHEALVLGSHVKQSLFRTRHGRIYRIVFAIQERGVHILRVRGPGQPNLQADEIADGS